MLYNIFLLKQTFIVEKSRFQELIDFIRLILLMIPKNMYNSLSLSILQYISLALTKITKMLPIMMCAVKSSFSRSLYRMSAIHAKRPKVVTSPREAAIGVATLSGFTFTFLYRYIDAYI